MPKTPTFFRFTFAMRSKMSLDSSRACFAKSSAAWRFASICSGDWFFVMNSGSFSGPFSKLAIIWSMVPLILSRAKSPAPQARASRTSRHRTGTSDIRE